MFPLQMNPVLSVHIFISKGGAFHAAGNDKICCKETVCRGLPTSKTPGNRLRQSQHSPEIEWRELVIYNDESGGSYRAHIKANWYEYTLTILDRFGSIDSAFPVLPQIKSRKQFKTGSIVAVALPHGELIPFIIGEVRL